MSTEIEHHDHLPWWNHDDLDLDLVPKPRRRRARTAAPRRARRKPVEEDQAHWFPFCRTPPEEYRRPKPPRVLRAKHTAPPRPLTQAETVLVSQAYKFLKRAVGMYSNLTLRAGLDPDDAAQELLMIFSQRLQGEHPYDPARASLQNYCTMLVRSVLINRLAKRRRHSIGFDRLVDALGDRVGDLDLDAMSELVTPENAPPTNREARFKRLAEMALSNAVPGP
ncbi:hypothetical protein [Nannocystis sp. SCPEA4]|uniref:hypothetical protein n=1 Tax=Nannocystis sp. SCPEA4 TaxID=2996787 RepID=UPI002271A886|nr:hypothetical protein [Nannocystis sp. SCPEA4]MCY1055419.1 hypothetical protein [Nannocystis sp. SCPEA4]